MINGELLQPQILQVMKYVYIDANQLTFNKLFAPSSVKRYYEKISFILHFSSDNC